MVVVQPTEGDGAEQTMAYAASRFRVHYGLNVSTLSLYHFVHNESYSEVGLSIDHGAVPICYHYHGNDSAI